MEDCIQTTSLSPNATGTQLEEEGDGVTPRQRLLTNDHSHLPNLAITLHGPHGRSLDFAQYGDKLAANRWQYTTGNPGSRSVPPGMHQPAKQACKGHRCRNVSAMLA